MSDSTPPKPHVLAVDDEEHITELVAMALGIHGFEVERVASGRAALAAIEARRPDLVLLDVMLPDLDGFDVAKRLRQSEGLPPVVGGNDVEAIVRQVVLRNLHDLGFVIDDQNGFHRWVNFRLCHRLNRLV